MWLISDVVSNAKGSVYAKKGESVKVIHESFPAVIVEDESGQRFSTRVSNLTAVLVEKEAAKEQIIVKKDFQKRTKISTQQQLF
jgi:predicted transcriptional regulator